MTKTDLGRELAALRQAANLDQAEVAERMNVGKSTVSNWEAGSREPSLEAIAKYAQVCGFESELLFRPHGTPTRGGHIDPTLRNVCVSFTHLTEPNKRRVMTFMEFVRMAPEEVLAVIDDIIVGWKERPFKR